MPLTDSQIRNVKPGSILIKLTDGGGVSLEVRTGAKLWRYRYASPVRRTSLLLASSKRRNGRGS